MDHDTDPPEVLSLWRHDVPTPGTWLLWDCGWQVAAVEEGDEWPCGEYYGPIAEGERDA